VVGHVTKRGIQTTTPKLTKEETSASAMAWVGAQPKQGKGKGCQSTYQGGKTLVKKTNTSIETHRRRRCEPLSKTAPREKGETKTLGERRCPKVK